MPVLTLDSPQVSYLAERDWRLAHLLCAVGEYRYVPGCESGEPADMYLIFFLDRPDVLPVEDGAVRQVFSWLYAAPLTDAAVREVVCSLWHPYASVAVRYMYRALNTGIVARGEASEVLGL